MAPRSVEVSSSPAFGRMNTVGGGDGAALRRRRHLESVSRPSPACCRRGRPWSTCPAQPRTTARSPRDQHRAGADTESRSRTTATTARCEPRRCSGGVPRQADHRDRSRRRPCSILPPGIPTCPTSYFYQLQGQGMADTFSGATSTIVPTLIHPGEVMDGAIVSSVYARLLQSPTYPSEQPDHLGAAARHGRDSTVGSRHRGHNYTGTTERSSWGRQAAGMLVPMGRSSPLKAAESAIGMMSPAVSRAGGDRMSNVGPRCRRLRLPLFYTVPEADAIVSVGSEDEIVTMPVVGRVIGDHVLLDGETPAAGPLISRCTSSIAAPTNRLPTS